MRSAGRQRERPARRHAQQAALRIERVEQRVQVVLVGAASVQQHERARRLAGRRALAVGERHAAPRGGGRAAASAPSRPGRAGARTPEAGPSASPRCSRSSSTAKPGRAWRSRTARRSARGSRSSGTRSGRSRASAAGPPATTASRQASWSSIVDDQATWCTVPAPPDAAIRRRGIVGIIAAARLAADLPPRRPVAAAGRSPASPRARAGSPPAGRRTHAPRRSPAARARPGSRGARRSAARRCRDALSVEAQAFRSSNPRPSSSRVARLPRPGAAPRSRTPARSRPGSRPCGSSRRPPGRGARPGTRRT